MVHPIHVVKCRLRDLVSIEISVLVYLVSHAYRGRQSNQREYPISIFNEYCQFFIREHGRFHAVFYFYDVIELLHQIHSSENVAVCCWCDYHQLVCQN